MDKAHIDAPRPFGISPPVVCLQNQLQVLSYTLSPSLEVDFVLDAVDILMREHGVSLHAETVIHSDQGCHYTSCKFIELVEHNELRRSMSRKGNCSLGVLEISGGEGLLGRSRG